MGQVSYRFIAILTGAGVSAESGIKTFRDADGLWEGHAIEDVASPDGFRRDPETVYQFYNERRKALTRGDINPNPAHQALAKLSNEFIGKTTLITQNIDDLHERAGSVNVIHMHGELLKAQCVRSGHVTVVERQISTKSRCSCCTPPQALRPHVVWFGEMPLELDLIYKILKECDLFLSIGTSGVVYPAAGFVQMAAAAGAHTVELNLAPSAVQSAFKERIYGPAGSVVPEYIEGIL